jgi:hypothetical protein
MVDIHPPHHAPHSFREFALQIATVTVGIVIAIGLETGVEYLRDRDLARETRANLRAELTIDLDKLKSLEETLPSELAALDKTIAYGNAYLKHTPNLKAPDVSLDRTFPLMPVATWDATAAVGGLRLLSFGQARAVTDAYSTLGGMNEITRQAIVQWMGLSAVMTQGDITDAEVISGLPIVREGRSYARALQDLDNRSKAKCEAALKALAD